MYGQEDLSLKDTEDIIDDLKNGKTPKAGPRYGKLFCEVSSFIQENVLFYYFSMKFIVL